MNFATIASPDWVTALNICNVNLGDGIRQGNEYVFKNIFIGSHSYHSLRYLPHKKVFKNHCERGSNMRLTTVRFICLYQKF
ncbi:hypothetical protein [Fluviispira sanaruensis]|uniref:Uncharacterized protein n=1 Tax=Fluviispira sanaruensis TaxID=2493639 RepID=A0A4P2VLJ2_FLUSA|nr:hypothetical protein [Fluviispira sanaruensis]BBH53731.1 hypothetical protein JCM31447_21790 [Fluviispira sanaruensis]